MLSEPTSTPLLSSASADSLLHGAGLGLRRALLDPLTHASTGDIDFLECAPDNWIDVGGRLGDAFAQLASCWPLSCHGLSLSLGGSAPLDVSFLSRIRAFLDRHHVALYSEHLSWCADDGHLYELLPLPHTEQAVRHVAARIRQVQDMLGRRIAIENVSTYASPWAELDEAQFVCAVLAEADCDLLLDVNNIHVNSINHGFDAAAYLARMPSQRIVCYHVAGHYDQADDLKIDSHGATVKPAVWDLLAMAYAQHGVHPTLLERDFNFPPWADLLEELAMIRQLQQQATVRLPQRASA